MPKASSDGHKTFHQCNDLLAEAALLAEVTLTDDREDLVDGSVGGEGAVEDDKLSLQTLGDVIATSTWLNHRSQELRDKNNNNNNDNKQN